MAEYFDKQRNAAMKYYDIEESFTGRNLKSTKKKLEELIKEDPYYLDSYLLLSEVYIYEDNYSESDKILEMAYKNALELILDKNGNWPDSLIWGWLENRHIIRTLINKGIKYWQNDQKDLALKLFENLLRTNPNDNGGVRYLMLGIKTGLSEEAFNNKFDKGGYWDQDIDIWFSKNINKYKKDFKVWLDEIDQEE